LPQQIDIADKIITTDVVQGTFELFCDTPGTGFYNWQSVSPTNRNTFRPLIGGISSSNFTSMSGGTGTLGFFAIDNDTNSLVGVTNNHVYIDDAFICSERNSSGLISNVKGDVVSQKYEFPGDNNPIGVVKKYYPIRLSPAFNYVDVAVTTINSGDTSYSTSYNQEGLTPTTYPFASTSEIDNLISTDPLLYSAGRTTGGKGEGTTKLRIYSFPSTANIWYTKQSSSGLTYFSDLISFVATTGVTFPYSGSICDYPIYYGDSGSALIADFSGTKKIIGLCFAGSTTYGMACRIDRIATLMNLSAWNGEAVSFSDTANILEYTVNGLSDSEYIDFEGKRYWQVGLRNIS
jgi:hypothetical protein